MVNVARVAATFRAYSTPEPLGPTQEAFAVITFHVMRPASEAAIDETVREDILFHVAAWWDTDNGGFVETKSAYPLNFELVHLECRTILPAASDLTETIFPEPIAGSSATRSMYPPQCCFVLGLRTLVDSRSGRGRIYLPAWEPGDENSRIVGFVTAENQQQIANIGAHLAYEMRQVDEPEGPFRLCVFSRVLADPAPVVTFDVNDRVCTQRRRAIRPLTHRSFDIDGDPF